MEIERAAKGVNPITVSVGALPKVRPTIERNDEVAAAANVEVVASFEELLHFGRKVIVGGARYFPDAGQVGHTDSHGAATNIAVRTRSQRAFVVVDKIGELPRVGMASAVGVTEFVDTNS